MVYFGFFTPCFMACFAAENCGPPITGDPIRGTTINLIKVLEVFHNMPSLSAPELVHLDEPTSPINNDKKVNFLPLLRTFSVRSVLIQSMVCRFNRSIVSPEALA